MPQISVVIPVYNAQKTLEKCLQSIFNQTFKDFEIIAVNDGSTDQSQKILENHQAKIKIINQKNQGAPAARNAGARQATGSYLIFCDADIFMQPNMLESMWQTLNAHPQSSFCYSDFKFGWKVFKLWPFDKEKLKKMPYIHTTSLIRKQDFPGFDENLKRFQDWDLWLTMSEQGKSGWYLPKTLFTVFASGTISQWFPKSFYNFPWLKRVKQYQVAEKIIKQKHNL
ncbi:MAG: glycosyltransferase family A protein [Candidatus Buchananbacteria bacterium]